MAFHGFVLATIGMVLGLMALAALWKLGANESSRVSELIDERSALCGEAVRDLLQRADRKGVEEA